MNENYVKKIAEDILKNVAKGKKEGVNFNQLVFLCPTREESYLARLVESEISRKDYSEILRNFSILITSNKKGYLTSKNHHPNSRDYNLKNTYVINFSKYSAYKFKVNEGVGVR